MESELKKVAWNKLPLSIAANDYSKADYNF